MSYVGTADVSGLPELESVRRLRESGVLREGGPGSGPHKGAGSEKQAQSQHIAKMKAQGHTLLKKGKFPNGSSYHNMRSPSGRVTQYEVYPDQTGRKYTVSKNS